MSLNCFFCPAVQKPRHFNGREAAKAYLVKVINFYQQLSDILLKDCILKIFAIYCL